MNILILILAVLVLAAAVTVSQWRARETLTWVSAEFSEHADQAIDGVTPTATQDDTLIGRWLEP